MYVGATFLPLSDTRVSEFTKRTVGTVTIVLSFPVARWMVVLESIARTCDYCHRVFNEVVDRDGDVDMQSRREPCQVDNGFRLFCGVDIACVLHANSSVNRTDHL